MRSLGIDCRFASGYGGLGTFTREIVAALLRRNTTDQFVLFVTSDTQAWLKEFVSRPTISTVVVTARPYSLSEQIHFPSVLAHAGIDLLYVPHFNVPLFCPVPFVCTVHDLILHHYPNQASFLKRLAYRIVMWCAVHRAKRVITVSNYTRKDLLARYRISPQKVVTVYLGISDHFAETSDVLRKETTQAYDIEKPFFLYVGNCKEHKNVQTLIDAFSAADLPTHELLLASSGSECARLQLKPGVRFIGPIHERLLPSLYSLAAGFVTATKLEGFCLPVLEAMACDCPVAASNVGPIPEISGGHVLLLPPDVDAFATAMRTIAEEPTLSSPERLESARLWARRFTWKHAAEELRGTLVAL